MPEDPKTKPCDKCSVTIAKTETKCPACGETQLDEEDISVVERAQRIIEARKKAATPPTPTPTTATTSASRFARLRDLRKKA